MRRHVYFYTHLGDAFEAAAATLSGDPARWLPPPAAAQGDDWRVRLCADGALPRALAEHDALVRPGPPADCPGGLLRAVSWRSGSNERSMPVLTADLELVRLSGSGCQLSLMGSYRPPLSVVGEAGDRLLGHRVAEACVRRFVLDVAARLSIAALSA